MIKLFHKLCFTSFCKNNKTNLFKNKKGVAKATPFKIFSSINFTN